MSAMNRTGVFLLSLAAVALGGCSGFDRLDFHDKSAPPDNAVVQYEGIRIHEGIAVGVVGRPMDGNDVMSDDTKVELESRDPNVLGVGPGVPDDPNDSSKANWNFVFYGVSAGSTSVLVRVNGENQSEIPATVETQ